MYHPHIGRTNHVTDCLASHFHSQSRIILLRGCQRELLQINKLKIAMKLNYSQAEFDTRGWYMGRRYNAGESFRKTKGITLFVANVTEINCKTVSSHYTRPAIPRKSIPTNEQLIGFNRIIIINRLLYIPPTAMQLSAPVGL